METNVVTTGGKNMETNVVTKTSRLNLLVGETSQTRSAKV